MQEQHDARERARVEEASNQFMLAIEAKYNAFLQECPALGDPTAQLVILALAARRLAAAGRLWLMLRGQVIDGRRVDLGPVVLAPGSRRSDN